MSFTGSFVQMLVLFLLVIVGYIANKTKIMDDNFNRSFSSLIINVSAPFTILSSVMSDTLPNPGDILPIIIAGTCALLVMVLLSFGIEKLLKVPSEESGIYRFMLTFGNVGFIGFPVVTALFGNYAIFYASVFSIPFNLLLFVVGVIFVTKGKRTTRFNWRIFLSPCLSATYLTIIIVLAQYSVPRPIAQASILIGQVTVPGSLLIIGSTLATIPVKQMLGGPRLYAMCAIKLLAVPALLLFMFSLMPIDKKYTDVLVILCAMPVASYGAMICLKYGIDTKTMAQGTFLTTFLSVITIPLLSIIL